MNDHQDNFNSRSAQKVAKGSLWVIGLSVVLAYVFATLVIVFGKIPNDSIWGFILFCILVFLPGLVFFELLWSLKKHYAYYSAKHKDYLFKMRKLETVGEACLVVARAMKIDTVKEVNELRELLKEMLNHVSEIYLNDNEKTPKQ
jgi:hypothetical protein